MENLNKRMLLYKPCKFINLKIKYSNLIGNTSTSIRCIRICLQQWIMTKHMDMYMSTGMINNTY